MALSPYQWAIEELSLSGEIGLGRCSPSTVYRWARKINEQCAVDKVDWRVKPVVADQSIIVDPDWTPEKVPTMHA